MWWLSSRLGVGHQCRTLVEFKRCADVQKQASRNCTISIHGSQYDPIISLALWILLPPNSHQLTGVFSWCFVTWFYAGECPIFHPTFQPFDLDPLARIGLDHHSRSSKGTGEFFGGTDIWWMMVGTKRKILSEHLRKSPNETEFPIEKSSNISSKYH